MGADPPPGRESTLEEVLARRVPGRRRALQGLGLVLALVVVAGLLSHSIATAGKQAQKVNSDGTLTPLGPVVVLSNLSYGSVRVNGRLLDGPPPMATTLQPGPNTISLTAPPFGTRTCLIQWPDAQTQGACDIRRDVVVGSHVGGRLVIPVAIVKLWLGGDDLPAAVRDRALANVAAMLEGMPLRTSVPAGDYVAMGQDISGHIASTRTDVPLRADLFVTASGLDFGGDVFCEDDGCATVPLGGMPRWAVEAGLSVQWQFTPLAGGGQPLRPSPSGTVDALRLVLVADVAGNWTVDQQSTTALNGFSVAIGLPSTDCAAGVTYLATHAPSDQLSVGIVADAGLSGCALELTDAGRFSRGSFVWRFGVLLAADAQAHAALPDLPMAPPDEVAAVAV